jgi:hypothetical protein
MAPRTTQYVPMIHWSVLIRSAWRIDRIVACKLADNEHSVDELHYNMPSPPSPLPVGEGAATAAG